MMFVVGRSDENIGLCCLCDACKPAYRMDCFIDGQGTTTCREHALEMADASNSSKQENTVCRSLQSQHRRTCCDPNYKPVEIPQIPVVGVKNPYTIGKYNPCDLCSGGKYPGNPNTFVAVLYQPVPDTCKDLYWYSLAGRIEDSWCRPIQNYYMQPCGCASGSGGSTGGGTNNTPSTGLLQKAAKWRARFFDSGS